MARAAMVNAFNKILGKAASLTEETLKARYREDYDHLLAERASMAEQLGLAETAIAETEEALLAARYLAETRQTQLADAQRDCAVWA